MEGLAIIPTHSERQAMDWSLVLLSQGIEAVIQPPDAEHGWRLVLDPSALDSAWHAIRQYQAENHRPAWVRELPGTGLWFDARSVVWCLLLVVFFALSETRVPSLRTAGLMDSEAVFNGQWWRLFTAVMLHGDWGHLAANVSTGVLLLGLAMGGYGAGFGVLAAFLSGVIGNMAGLFLYNLPHRGLGASGMVMGALGLLTVQSIDGWRVGVRPKQLMLRSLAGGVLLLILLGLNPNSDVIAHVGGFFGGVILGAILGVIPPAWLRRRGPNRAAELLCAGLMLLTWFLAFRGMK